MPDRAHRTDVRTATIGHGRQRWSLAPGKRLTFGRAEDRDIRLGHVQDDDHVSREAGALLGLADSVLVENGSATKCLYLQPLPGQQVEIIPKARAALPEPRQRLVVPGRFDVRYTITINLAGLLTAADPETTASEEGATVPPIRRTAQRTTRTQAERLSATEEKVLAALCEPLLTEAGAHPATRRQIADRLHLSPNTVKKHLDELRVRLHNEDGIPGLGADEDSGDGAPSYLPALATWARCSGTITLEELDRLLAEE